MHTFQITWPDVKRICRETSTPIPGVGEFRKISYLNVCLHLNNTGHRYMQCASRIKPTALFHPTAHPGLWRLT